MSSGNLTGAIASLPLLRKRRPLAYLIALAMCAVAWWLRTALDSRFPPGFPYLTFFPAVILSSFLFGRGPGAMAGVLCGLLAWYFFIPPFHSFGIGHGTQVALGFYAGVVIVDIALVHWMQRANARLQREQERSRAAEERLAQLNNTLEQRIASALSERQVLADVVENSTAPVMVLSREGRVLAINAANVAAFEQAFGTRPLIGDELFALIGHMPEHRAQLHELWSRALGGESFIVTQEFGDETLTQRSFEVRFDTLYDREGSQIGAVSTAYDVTARARAEADLATAQQQLRQSQKMEAVGQLTGGLAHDFNNLLTGISGSLEMMAIRIGQGRMRDVEKYNNAAQAAARRAAALTHRLLAFSRRQTLDPKATEANRLIADMLDMIQRTVGPAVEVRFGPGHDLWTTLVDPNQLENAVLNLSINARDAMPDGGKLTIETSNRTLDEGMARIHELEPGRYVALCVSDNGTGMPPEVIAKAFDPFFTTKPLGVGTGLGLSMIYGFARQSNGNVRIHSAVGEGTTICLYLPRHAGSADVEQDGPDLAGAPRAEYGETVLVVDDEPSVRMLVTDVLEELGYIAIEAADGAAGLKVLQSDAHIDLLVSDVGLPGGMNGRQMADAARVGRPDLKVLFITGYAENAAVGNGPLDPGMHVMTKPFAMEALATRIRTLMEEAE
jgi:PAS domain S-box-containing protein